MLVRDLFNATAQIYDGSRRQLVPCFDDFYRTALELIPFAADAPLQVVDLGAGTGLLSALVAAAFPHAQLLLLDVSAEMLAQAQQRFVATPDRFEFHLVDLNDAAIPACDVAISALAIHHLAHDRKAALFRRTYDALRPGGVFINADQALGPTPQAEAVNHQAWLRHAAEAGATAADISMAMDRMRADITAPLLDQLRWLEEAGFNDVDCGYKNYMFAVYSGRKPT